MKKFRVILTLSIAISAIFFSDRTLAGDLERSKYGTLGKMIDEGVLMAQIRGMSGHEGECVMITIRNISGDTSFILLEPGRILQSIDTSVQDILITREERLVLAPGAQQKFTAFGFCSQATLSSPDSAEVFSMGKMADSSLISLAIFLNENENKFPVDAIQQAVWCISDNYSIMDIYGEDLASINELRNYVADLKGLDHVLSSNNDQTPYWRSIYHYTHTVSGEIEVYFASDCLANILIIDREGKEYKSLAKQKSYKAGYYRFTFSFTTTDWPKGEYFIIVESAEAVLYRKEFTL